MKERVSDLEEPWGSVLPLGKWGINLPSVSERLKKFIPYDSAWKNLLSTLRHPSDQQAFTRFPQRAFDSAQRSLHPCGPVEKSCAHCKLVSPQNSRRKRTPDLCSLLNTVLIVFLWLLSSWPGFVLTNSGQSLLSHLENLPRSHCHGFYQQRIGAVPSKSLPESTDIHRVSPMSKCWVLSAGYSERKRDGWNSAPTAWL